MILCIGDVLNRPELDEINSKLAELAFVDGRVTAGWSARLVKDNEQAEASEQVETLKGQIAASILENELFQIAVRPKTLTPLLISRYGPGHQYGTHVDDALMQGLRTDVSFTLFLADSDTYVGGELVIESSAGEQPFKLSAGSMIVYPSTFLHRVAPVESGLRMAAVGWARSYVRSTDNREILFDLETARHDLFTREGKSNAFDLLSKCSANLLRLWSED